METPKVHRLILTVGLPYSGKTTWALLTNLPVVSPDCIRMAIHGMRFIPETEPLVWAIARIMVRALFLTGHDNVILDACNNTRKRRDEWLDDLWDVEYQIMREPASVCIRRAIADNDDEIIPVIQRMWDEHEPVDEATDSA